MCTISKKKQFHFLFDKTLFFSALRRRMARLESVKCIAKCCSILRPFTFLFGIVFLLLTLLIVISISLTALDKILNSYCGAKCGFILKYPQIFNPLDKLLVLLSAVFDHFPFQICQNSFNTSLTSIFHLLILDIDFCFCPFVLIVVFSNGLCCSLSSSLIYFLCHNEWNNKNWNSVSLGSCI